MSERGIVKLGDYGLTDHVEHTSKRMKSADLLLYTAPEEFAGKGEMKSDVWSLGVTLAELAEGKNPFEGCNQMQLMKKLMTESPSLSGEGWSAECVDFVGKCVVRSVEERWTVSQLMDVSAVPWSDD